MKIKSILNKLLIGLLALALASLIGLSIWSAAGTYPARTDALAALESTDRVSVTRGGNLVFTPRQETTTGLIFYPGGLVEPAAYAPVLRQLAAEGILVVITPMPLNLAILKTGAATAVMADHPEIDTWILAGHSLGGAAAGIFAEKHPEAIDALALWDSYPPDSADLADNELAVISIYGTRDGVPNTDNFDAKRRLLPPDAIFSPIEGASHAQFGDYGPQRGDVVPTLSLAEQHQRVAEIMLEFIGGLQ